MAWFTGKMPKSFKYPLETARTVCLVKAVETPEEGEKEKRWSADKARETTQLLMAESAARGDAQKFIADRAALAFSRMAKDAPTIKSLRWRRGTGILTAVVLILGSYLVGAFGERFLATGTEINLFSPLLVAAFGWSLVFYALIAIAGVLGIVRRRHAELPLRTPLAKLSSGLFAPKLVTSGLRRRFLAIWAPAVLRIAQFRIARVMHWAFLAFCAGIISSIIVRGIGNGAYLIGWELPGLGNAPEQVQDLFSALFGWIPGFLNLPPLPDAETVASMRLDRLAMAPETGPEIAPAAAWLPRLALLFSAFILIPRLLLIAWDTLAIRFLSGRVTIPCDAYFEAILKEEPAAAGSDAKKEEKAPDSESAKTDAAPEAKPEGSGTAPEAAKEEAAETAEKSA